MHLTVCFFYLYDGKWEMRAGGEEEEGGGGRTIAQEACIRLRLWRVWNMTRDRIHGTLVQCSSLDVRWPEQLWGRSIFS